MCVYAWRWEMKLTDGAHMEVRGSCKTQLSEREREKQGRGNFVFLPACADCAPACLADLACHVGKCGKYVRRAKQEC